MLLGLGLIVPFEFLRRDLGLANSASHGLNLGSGICDSAPCSGRLSLYGVLALAFARLGVSGETL